MLDICEVFESIQGESSRAGEPCVFVRLTGCNLACTYCDTAYAREPGVRRTVEGVVDDIRRRRPALVEITGGEPLLQADTPDLCARLLDTGKRVLVETNGACDIAVLPEPVVRIMDVKCPGSGMADRFLLTNIKALRPADECKFVLTDRADFDWAERFVAGHALSERCLVIFSPAWSRLDPADLAEWILAEGLQVRLGLQLHKIIWPGKDRGV